MFLIPCNSPPRVPEFLPPIPVSAASGHGAHASHNRPPETRVMKRWSDWPQSAVSKLHLHIKYSSVLPLHSRVNPQSCSKRSVKMFPGCLSMPALIKYIFLIKISL